MFELYQAELRWRERLSGHVTTDLKLGRQLLIDALTPGGWDALDGATLRLGLPYIVLEGTGGLAVRREWNALGPDVFAPDGAALPERPGYIVGAAAEVANIETVHARVGWRRQFEASDRVQREDVGGAITLGPWANASLESGARFDLIYHWLGEVYAQAGFGDADLWRLTAGWRYERPTFGADSIWNAFSVMPWQDLTLRGHVNPGLWRLNADAGARRFDAGPADAQAPGAELVGVDALHVPDVSEPLASPGVCKKHLIAITRHNERACLLKRWLVVHVPKCSFHSCQGGGFLSD
jgi:hypothetical protein